MNALDEIRTFLAVARHRSFTLAARQLELSPTAVSKGVRVMEQKHGVVLFRRTTRSVSLTEAGEKLLAALRPAVDQIEDAFDALAQFRDRPAGRLRLTAPRAFGFLAARVLVPRMRASYPEIDFDLTLDDGLADLVAQGYDAGIRLGQSIAQDMVAVRLSRPLAWSVVAAPQYFDRHGFPASPRELLRHRAIRYRFGPAAALDLHGRGRRIPARTRGHAGRERHAHDRRAGARGPGHRLPARHRDRG
jgi:DNA-binding transcriptional LysR family regulator